MQKLYLAYTSIHPIYSLLEDVFDTDNLTYLKKQKNKTELSNI